MKKVFLKTSTLMLGLSMMFSACKKDKNEEPDDTQEQMTTASDQSMVSAESDQAVEDVNGVFSNSASLSGRVENYTPCGASVDSIIGDKKMTITFNGKTCDGRRNRIGIVTAQLISGEKKWSETGAIIRITFTNFKVTRLADGKSIVINGTHDITNVSGGLVRSMASGESRVHKVRANMSITFDDGTIRTWGAARLRTFALNSGTYTITETGDSLINGEYPIIWGTNRKGNNFRAINTTPIKASTCGSSYPYTWKVIEGVRVHKGLIREITITFGFDYDANTFSNDCSATGYKINWIGALNKPKEAKVKIYN